MNPIFTNSSDLVNSFSFVEFKVVNDRSSIWEIKIKKNFPYLFKRVINAAFNNLIIKN